MQYYYININMLKSSYVFLLLLLQIFNIFQVLLIFMQRMEMLLSKTPPSDVKSDVLPMVYRALESDTAQIQELCLSMVPAFAGMYLIFSKIEKGCGQLDF